MLRDELGVYGGSTAPLAKGLSNDALYNSFERREPLWESSELNVRSELGISGYPTNSASGSTFASAAVPGRRTSGLASVLNTSLGERKWDPLDGIDRYWPETGREAQAAGDMEERRRVPKAPREGHVRIVVPHMEKGQEHIGIVCHGLQVVSIRDPKAVEMGFCVGDEVLKVNRMAVSDSQEFATAMQGAVATNRRNQAPILIDVWRQPVCSVHHGPGARAPPRGPIPTVPLSLEDRERVGHSAAMGVRQPPSYMEALPSPRPGPPPQALMPPYATMPTPAPMLAGVATPPMLPYGSAQAPMLPGVAAPPMLPYGSDQAPMLPGVATPPLLPYGFDPRMQMEALAEENAMLQQQLFFLQQARQPRPVW